MLIASSLRDELIDALCDVNDPSVALQTMWETICAYVSDEAQVTYVWTGVNPSGVKDPESIIFPEINTGCIFNLDVSGRLVPKGMRKSRKGRIVKKAIDKVSGDAIDTIPFSGQTKGMIFPTQDTSPGSALLSVAAQINAMILATWSIDWPLGFELTPANVIPMVVLTPSMATTQEDALLYLSESIINGIHLATVTAEGSHGPFVGTAIFSGIL